ncbi:protein kinase domain-containing protein [Planctomycetes bacterium K23_9]|uniref:Serine/threonine-protein kinase PrkC n=1 Tax=Stieleria marina TaxID=1930275 RepID=A0A517NWN3_9BACT|nr:Serine/threonine-protein kinase PrkC [Planctomycetes bacterium K23_9]
MIRPKSSETDPTDEPTTVEEASDRLADAWSCDSLQITAAPDFVGKQIGRYSIKRIVGSGGHGVVYLAHDQTLDRDVALKIPRPEVLLNDDRRRRFDDEARTAARLDHPAIVKVYEAELTGAIPYIASAFCTGTSLARWIGEQGKQCDCLDSAFFMNQLALAVQYAHEQGVVHRDLKPGNVLLATNEEGDFAKDSLRSFEPRLTDFGLARLAENCVEDTRSSLVVGTPLYMSPEQASDQRTDVGPASDIFSLGAILYHLLTGAPPFEAETYFAVLTRVREGKATPIADIRPDVDRDLATICMKCLQNDPRDRYASCKDLADDLHRYANGESILARPLNAWQSVLRWSRQKARIGEATGAMILISITRAVFGLISLGMIHFASGFSLTDTELSEVLLAHAMITAPTEAWLIWVSRMNYKRKLPNYLYWITWVFILAWGLTVLLIGAGVIQAPLWYQRSPGARAMVFSIIGMLFAAQAVCWYVADWNRTQEFANQRRHQVGASWGKLSSLAAAVVIFSATLIYKYAAPTAKHFDGPTNAISLDGKNDCLTIQSVGFGESEPFTLEAWVRADDSRKAIVVQHGPVAIGTVATSNGNRFHMELAQPNDEILLLDTVANFKNGQWVHLAITYDQSSLVCFINGEPQTIDISIYEDTESGSVRHEDSLPTPLKLRDIWPGAMTFIGSNHDSTQPTGYFFAGQIGEVRLSRSVFYREPFVPSPTLSKNKDTAFLFHLNNQNDSHFIDETGQFIAEVER